MASDESIHSLAPAYALDGLDPEDERRFEAHLAECERCREDVEAYRESASALAYAVEPAEPPAELRERILTAARNERPSVVPLRPRRIAVPRRAVAAFAAVAAAIVVGLGLWAVLGNGGSGTRQVALSGAEGTLAVSGSGKASLTLATIRPAPAGKTYEIWVIDNGKPARAGLFPGGGRNVVVTLERRVPDGAVVAVTVEPAGGVDAPTSKPLFSAQV